jgi:hypothetical protein
MRTRVQKILAQRSELIRWQDQVADPKRMRLARLRLLGPVPARRVGGGCSWRTCGDSTSCRRDESPSDGWRHGSACCVAAIIACRCVSGWIFYTTRIPCVAIHSFYGTSFASSCFFSYC